MPRNEFHESKFRSKMDSDLMICPYCGYSYQPEAEDYSEDTREIECSECEKKFWAYQSFSVDHHAKPDCQLNGEQHRWDGVYGHPGWESCDVCDKWRHVPVPLPVSAGAPPHGS